MAPPPDLDRLLGPRDVLVVEGPDALTYLHSQVSQGLTDQAVGEQRWTFVLEPTGRIVGLARATRSGDERFELDIDAGFGAALLARLERFKIRVDATLTLHPAADGPGDGDVIDDGAEHDRIVAGWPRHGREIVPGETIPGATGLTGLAVDFGKGCYPGQELVERMDSRAAEAPRTLRRLTVAAGARPGDPILDGDTEVGVLTSVSGTAALGWVRRGVDAGVPVEF